MAEQAAVPETRWWHPIALSAALLTTLPVPHARFGRGAFGAASALFPLVGLALGAMLGGAGMLLDRILPPGPVAALLLVGGVLLTGGLHLDGVMDSADGVFGGRTPARRLEIMRDSRVGAYGVLAGVLPLLLQYACLAELTGTARLVALVVAMAVARWAMAVALALFPPARAEGLGATFRTGGAWWGLALASAVALATSAATGAVGAAGLLAAVVVALIGGRFFTARLGGLTGDAYGALAVATESLVYLAAVGLRA
jgi:adenosylcobinamide-GDP ribazoletransferase